MFLRRLGLYCAIALSPFAFLAGCSPTAGIGSTSAVPQSVGAYPLPSYSTSAPLPLANNQRGAQDIGAWPNVQVGGFSVGAFPLTPSGSATPAPVISITLGNNRAR